MYCSICFNNNIDNNSMCYTSCNHNYCKSCLDKWFDKGKNTCPNCRSEIKYFQYNNNKTRIIILDKNINNFREETYIYINNLKKQVFSLRLLLLFGLITIIYVKNNCIDTTESLTEQYDECNHNNSILINYLTNKEYLNIFYNNHYYNCMFPLSIINECIKDK